MENFFQTILTDPSQRFFFMSILGVVLLTITLIIVASVSKVRFYKNLFLDIKQLNQENQNDIEQLKREKLAIKTKNNLLEEKLVNYEALHLELASKNSLIATILNRANHHEESELIIKEAFEKLTQENLDLQLKYKNLQKRNEILVEENSSYRSENKQCIQKTKEFEGEINKYFTNQLTIDNKTKLKELSETIAQQNNQFLMQIIDKSIFRGVEPLLEEILLLQRDLTCEYSKRVSKEMNFGLMLATNIELHNQIKREESFFSFNSEEPKKASNSKGLFEYIVKISQIGSKHIKTIDNNEHSYRVELPYGQDIIIDIGVPTLEYYQYVHAQKSSEKERALRDVIDKCESYILHNAQNSDSKQPNFTIIYFPLLEAYELLVRHKSELYTQSYENHLLLVTSSDLLLLLQGIARLWGYYYNIKRVESLESSTQELEEQLLRVVSKFVQTAQNLELLQESLNIDQNNQE